MGKRDFYSEARVLAAAVALSLPISAAAQETPAEADVCLGVEGGRGLAKVSDLAGAGEAGALYPTSIGAGKFMVTYSIPPDFCDISHQCCGR